MEPTSDIEAFSHHRLSGEPVPGDVQILLAHADELSQMTGVELKHQPDWAPWLDTSYLSVSERANPDIAANVKAISDACGLIAFIAAYEDGEYFGYWRGPTKRRVADSPIAHLDNEGQFKLCGGSSFAEALLSEAIDDDQFEEWRNWMVALGIAIRPTSISEMTYPSDMVKPEKLHSDLYHRYLA